MKPTPMTPPPPTPNPTPKADSGAGALPKDGRRILGWHQSWDTWIVVKWSPSRNMLRGAWTTDAGECVDEPESYVYLPSRPLPLAPAPAPEGRGETAEDEVDDAIVYCDLMTRPNRDETTFADMVPVPFARKLKRERDEARAERDKLRDGNHQLDFDLALRRLKNNQLCALINNFESELTKAREEIAVRNEQIMRERDQHSAQLATLTATLAQREAEVLELREENQLLKAAFIDAAKQIK